MGKKDTTKAKKNQVEQKFENEEIDDEEIPKFECPDFQIDRLYFKAQEINKESPQLMCFPKYMYDENQPLTAENFDKCARSVLFLTKPIKMIKGGIPKYDPQFHKEGID